ncbi:MAG: YHS domain-containing protein [Hyphomonadaceae bacterium]|nr:YHS domain-containing protein [Hyphomonadaceae bacterium]
MKLRTLIAAAVVAAGPVALTAPAAFADKDPIYTAKRSNLALQGYDTVAYFTVGEPTKGSAEYSTTHNGAEFRFASEENLNLFLGNPDQYAPQYGGYCAWAVAKGKTAKGDARRWAIVDDKLYLNYNKGIQKKWDKDRSGFITDANTNWPTVLQD